jgi:hypothetical protein
MSQNCEIRGRLHVQRLWGKSKKPCPETIRQEKDYVTGIYEVRRITSPEIMRKE